MSASPAHRRAAPSGGARASLAGVLAVLAATSALLVAFAAPARAERVIELFTSHGCSSCPRADRLLGELSAADSGPVALEFHVDCWNSLVHGGDGNFVDPVVTAIETLGRVTADGSLRTRVAGPLGTEEGCAVLVRHDAIAADPKASAPSGSAAGPRTRLTGMPCPDPA